MFPMYQDRDVGSGVRASTVRAARARIFLDRFSLPTLRSVDEFVCCFHSEEVSSPERGFRHGFLGTALPPRSLGVMAKTSEDSSAGSTSAANRGSRTDDRSSDPNSGFY